MRIFCILCALIVSGVLSIKSQANDSNQKLIWHVSHFPPGNILEGSFKGHGFADRTRAYFQDRLKTYTHNEQIIGFRDSFEKAHAQDAFCRADLIKTPAREKFLYYSKPIYFMSGRRIVFAQEKTMVVQPFLNKRGDVQFETFIQTPNVRFSYVKGRAYFRNEPPAFTRYKQENPDLGFKTSREAFEAVINLNADFTIVYPWEHIYYLREGKLKDIYRSMRVQNMSPFALGYIACSKTKQGQNVITQVNAIVNRQNGMYAWMYFYKDWVSKTEWARVQRYYENVVKAQN